MNEEYAVNSENLKKDFDTASRLKRLFDYFQLYKIDRQQNKGINKDRGKTSREIILQKKR